MPGSRIYRSATPTAPAAIATAPSVSLLPAVGAAAPAVEEAEPEGLEGPEELGPPEGAGELGDAEDSDEVPVATDPVTIGTSSETALKYDGGAAVKLRSCEIMLPSPSTNGAS